MSTLDLFISFLVATFFLAELIHSFRWGSIEDEKTVRERAKMKELRQLFRANSPRPDIEVEVIVTPVDQKKLK